jgi:hypothetical protein
MVPISIPGDLGTVSWVKISNLSPFLLQLNNINGGTEWLEPSLVAAYPVPGLSTAIQATPYNEYGTAASSALSSVIAVTWYGYGEQPSGTFPVSLSGLTNVGNPNVGIASQVVNDGNASGTSVLESTPAGGASSYLVMKNDGTFQVQTISSGTLTDVLHVTAGSGGVAASLVLRLIDAMGVTQLDNTAIYTSGTGDLRFKDQNNLVNGNHLHFYVASGTAYIRFDEGSAGATYQTVFGIDDNLGNDVFPFGIGTPVNITTKSYVDFAGVLHAAGPVTLISGNQETGKACTGGQVSGAAQNVLGCINFKTTMTNAPSSLTMNVASSNLFSSLFVGGITTSGAFLQIASSAAGYSFWQGSYTTVGNCLLAVDATARTFDHHCDVCGHVSTATPLGAIEQTLSPEAALSYVCPACGATECFNCALTAADEADTTPQGSGQYATTRGAQATLIRQLLVALGLPTAP